MRAAVSDRDDTIRIAEVSDPVNSRATVLAAGLNPVDVAIARGMVPFRQLTADAVLGYEGVARTSGGDVVYFIALLWARN